VCYTYIIYTADTTVDLDATGYSDSLGGYVDTSYLAAARHGVVNSDSDEGGDKEEEEEEGEETDEGDGHGGGVRRSRRKTKGKRLQFWKNERSVYMKVGPFLS
jgi:hypothetical protein